MHWLSTFSEKETHGVIQAPSFPHKAHTRAGANPPRGLKATYSMNVLPDKRSCVTMKTHRHTTHINVLHPFIKYHMSHANIQKPAPMASYECIAPLKWMCDRGTNDKTAQVRHDQYLSFPTSLWSSVKRSKLMAPSRKMNDVLRNTPTTNTTASNQTGERIKEKWRDVVSYGIATDSTESSMTPFQW